eukprot:COSAG06_NODE_948_length_11359_cov_6.236146_1_plen_100_part_00
MAVGCWSEELGGGGSRRCSRSAPVGRRRFQLEEDARGRLRQSNLGTGSASGFVIPMTIKRRGTLIYLIIMPEGDGGGGDSLRLISRWPSRAGGASSRRR